MTVPSEALDLENRSIGPNGEPTLALAYDLLLAEWRRGTRDRELGLHLMFVAWYLLCEPPHVTGLDDSRAPSYQLPAVFSEVHDHFRPTIMSDAEMLYAVGLMAQLFPYLLGEESSWTAIALKYRSQYRALVPQGLSPSLFVDRGAYGDYFSGQVQVRDGY